MIPQIIMIAWMCLNLGIVIAYHGKPTDGKYSIWVSMISLLAECVLLYYGGFWIFT